MKTIDDLEQPHASCDHMKIPFLTLAAGRRIIHFMRATRIIVEAIPGLTIGALQQGGKATNADEHPKSEKHRRPIQHSPTCSNYNEETKWWGHCNEIG